MPSGTLMIMGDLIDDAVRVLRSLPDDVQAAAARTIIDYGAGHDDDIQLSDDRRTTRNIHSQIVSGPR